MHAECVELFYMVKVALAVKFELGVAGFPFKQ